MIQQLVKGYLTATGHFRFYMYLLEISRMEIQFRPLLASLPAWLELVRARLLFD